MLIHPYHHRSHARLPFVPGASAWAQQLAAALIACAVFGYAQWRHRRRFGPHSGRLWLLAPLGKAATQRLARAAGIGHGPASPARALLALPLVAVIGYCLWRAGQQVTAGLDPNFTVDAWGVPPTPVPWPATTSTCSWHRLRPPGCLTGSCRRRPAGSAPTWAGAGGDAGKMHGGGRTVTGTEPPLADGNAIPWLPGPDHRSLLAGDHYRVAATLRFDAETAAVPLGRAPRGRSRDATRTERRPW
jgi:hypothetical protein